MTPSPPLPAQLGARLSGMMFLQYAIWGAWLPIFYPFLKDHHGLEPESIGNLFAIAAIGALLAPFIAGQIADRWFNTERFLGISHLVGAVAVWCLADAEGFDEILWISLVYSIVYAPTLPLTNSLSFHHLPDRDRDFGKVRVWGTVGWIVVGIGVGQWLLLKHTPVDASEEAVRAAQAAGRADAFRLSAILGVVMGLYCFTLPKTPPQKGKQAFAPKEAIDEILDHPKSSPVFWLFVIAFPVACVHQFYFVHTAGFLSDLELQSPFIQKIFGVGGGGLMTIGQMSEILVLAAMPFIAKRVSRKHLLAIGLAAYSVRYAIFAFWPEPAAVVFALTMHGLCFGCFFFVAFLIVDEETTHDVRASAQGLFNFVVVGVGVIAGNLFAGHVAKGAAIEDGGTNYEQLFSTPLWISLALLGLLLLVYPKKPAPDGS